MRRKASVSMFRGALTISPPTFSPSDNLTHTVSPSDNWTAVCLVLVTVGPSPNPKVDELFVPPKNEHLYPKSRTNCHNVSVRPTATFAHINCDSWSNVFSGKKT